MKESEDMTSDSYTTEIAEPASEENDEHPGHVHIEFQAGFLARGNPRL